MTVANFNTTIVNYTVAADTDAGLALLQGNNFAGAAKSGTSLLPGATTGVKIQ